MNPEDQTTKIIRGCWQLAAGHSQSNIDMQPILDAVEAGFTVFDCADIYVGVEDLLGKASKVVKKKLRIHTKFVPDLNCLPDIDCKYIRNIIERSLKRLQVECIDLVQFHWWNWEIKKYLFTMEILSELKAEGKIASIGLTNVNKKYLQEFSDRFDITSLQVQVSLFDKRIERGVGELCHKNNIKVFAYGSLLGGFISEQWLGREEPQLEQLSNRSLIKYKLLIDSACGWNEYQQLLNCLNELAFKYHCKIANIAIAALLQNQLADAVIVGLSPKNFVAQNRSLINLPRLENNDLQAVNTWICNLPGDIYDAERDINDVHANIMKYNLNVLQ